MQKPFFGNKLSQTYPTKQLYNRGSNLVPHAKGSPVSSSVSEVLKSEAGKLVATAISNRIKGGNPDNINGDSNDKSNSKKSRRRGRGGSNRNGNGSNDNGSNGSSSGITRGYQDQTGVSCLLFSSGVNSGLTVNTRIVTGNYTPLYLSSGYLFNVTDSNVDQNTPFRDELVNVIYPLIEGVISNKIQRYAGRYISSEDFEGYILSFTKASQIYYCIDNILTYCSNNTISNVNVGMEHLRSQLSAECLVEFNLLRETLETMNCPSNLLNYIRFMCQAYRTSNAPHSSIIKLNIGGMFDPEWVLGPNKITQLVKSIRLDLISKNKMVTYLNQAFPDWIINSMPASSSEACYDPTFFTFWHNQNCAFMSTKSTNNGNFEYTIEVNSLDSYTDYQIIQDVNDVDGVVFVTQTYNIKKTDKNEFETYWGIWQPLATVDGKNTTPGDNRYTFNIKCFSVTGKIQSCLDDVVLGSSGIYNLVEYTGNTANWSSNLVKFGTYGFVKLQNVSVRMQTEAFNNAMRFWFMGE